VRLFGIVDVLRMLPNMPISKVISWTSGSDFPRNSRRASSREKAAVHLGPLALSSRAAISRSPFLARPMASRAMELQTSKEILAEIFHAQPGEFVSIISIFPI